MNHAKLIGAAMTIAELIEKTDTDDRGVLLSHVATLLRERSQNYTATLIYKAAVEYGLPDVPNI